MTAGTIEKSSVEKAFDKAENEFGLQFDETGKYRPYIILNNLKREILTALKAQDKTIKQNNEWLNNNNEIMKKQSKRIEELRTVIKTLNEERFVWYANECYFCSGASERVKLLANKIKDLEAAGHEKCKWRYVTEKELKNCIADCIRDGCYGRK
jgi:uncharacterized coiled-coil protein SlyX